MDEQDRPPSPPNVVMRPRHRSADEDQSGAGILVQPPLGSPRNRSGDSSPLRSDYEREYSVRYRRIGVKTFWRPHARPVAIPRWPARQVRRDDWDTFALWNLLIVVGGLFGLIITLLILYALIRLPLFPAPLRAPAAS